MIDAAHLHQIQFAPLAYAAKISFSRENSVKQRFKIAPALTLPPQIQACLTLRSVSAQTPTELTIF